MPNVEKDMLKDFNQKIKMPDALHEQLVSNAVRLPQEAAEKMPAPTTQSAWWQRFISRPALAFAIASLCVVLLLPLTLTQQTDITELHEASDIARTQHNHAGAVIAPMAAPSAPQVAVTADISYENVEELDPFYVDEGLMEAELDIIYEELIAFEL